MGLDPLSFLISSRMFIYNEDEENSDGDGGDDEMVVTVMVVTMRMVVMVMVMVVSQISNRMFIYPESSPLRFKYTTLRAARSWRD